MRFVRALAVAALVLSSTLASAETPMIESIAPDGGPPAGGTVVTIRGQHLGNIAPPLTKVRPQCTPCPGYAPEVLFGGKHGELVSYTDEVIVVKTPPNAGGRYDVQVGGFYSQPVVLPDAFQYGSIHFEKILVPLVADRVPGAFGSLWSTELVGRNDNDSRVDVRQHIEPPFSGTTRWSGGDARSTFRPELTGSAAFLYHDRVSSGLAFNLRVRDLSRQADSWGTEVPLVRTKDAFVNQRMDMLNVPYEPESRVTLRIYDFDGDTGAEVPVVVRANESDAVLGSTVIRFPSGSYLDAPATPGYVALDLRSIVTNEIAVQSVRVQVGEQGLERRLWAFVAVTDLETQQVTLITPMK